MSEPRMDRSNIKRVGAVGNPGSRSRWPARLGVLVVSALILVATLSTERFDSGEWYRRLVGWLTGSLQHTQAPAAAPHAAPMVAAAQPANRAARPTPRALPGTDSTISPKTLPLFLTATVVGRTVWDGYAMIGVSLENPQTYVGGAIIENGARLKEIHSKYVVLERNGRTTRLYLNGTAEAGAQKPLADELTRVGGSAPVAQAAATSYELFTDYVRPNPIYDGTTLRGFEVYPGARSGPFQRMGLQPGDLIVSVDGQPIVDAEQATETFRSLAAGSALNATVIRKGRTESVSLDGLAIVADQESRQQGQGPAIVAIDSR